MGGKRNRGILGAAIGIVAAVALPFAAPAIATAVFGSTALGAMTAAGALYGAATGALSGSITGNMGRGALIGGVGGAAGGFIQGGGIQATQNALFGAPPVANAPPVGLSTPAIAEPSGLAGLEAAASMPPPAGTPTTFGEAFRAGFSGQPVAATGGIGSATTGAAGTAAQGAVQGAAGTAAQGAAGATSPSFFSAAGLGQAAGRVAAGLTTPSGLASVGQLAMTMYNKPPEGLTAAEQAYVNETAALAQTNRAAFDQRVAAARSLLQRGEANPEQAFAQASLGAQRRFQQAGMRDASDYRRGEIAGGMAGAAAVPAEFNRSYEATRAGLSAMPTTAPAGAASMALPAYRDAERREREYERDLASGVGGLGSALGGRSSQGGQKSIFA
jgi:hypothetical protein